MKRTFATRDVVLFYFMGKHRTGVIIDVEQSTGTATVAYGTRTFREQVNVGLRSGSPTCNALKLPETTYFYPEHIVLVDLDALRTKPNAHCLYGLLLELQRLYKHAVVPLACVHKPSAEDHNIAG